VLPVPARQRAAGTILAGVPDPATAGVAICARVSSSGQRGDLGRRVFRLAEYLTADGLAPAEIISGAGLGLSGHRTRLLGLLRDASVGTVVAGRRERLARFGVGYLEAAPAARGRKLIVVGQAEVSDELVRGVGEVLAGFCARLYGRRSAKHRAELALAAARGAGAA
jgi:predicted site-specific integrase-resolvase